MMCNQLFPKHWYNNMGCFYKSMSKLHTALQYANAPNMNSLTNRLPS